MDNKENLLKDFCEKHSIVITGDYSIKETTDWDNVKFVKVKNTLNNLTKDKIYPINDGLYLSRVTLKYDDRASVYNVLHIDDVIPVSTEDFYLQLIRESKKLYGDIKEGDLLDAPWFNGPVRISKMGTEYSYVSLFDTLRINEIKVYQKGVWAKKVDGEQKRKVKTLWNKYRDTDQNISCDIHLKISGIKDSKISKINEGFIKKLEDLINGILE